jgi:hypothetical protein
MILSETCEFPMTRGDDVSALLRTVAREFYRYYNLKEKTYQ